MSTMKRRHERKVGEIHRFQARISQRPAFLNLDSWKYTGLQIFLSVWKGEPESETCAGKHGGSLSVLILRVVVLRGETGMGVSSGRMAANQSSPAPIIITMHLRRCAPLTRRQGQ
jgi:hypothetical protein